MKVDDKFGKMLGSSFYHPCSYSFDERVLRGVFGRKLRDELYHQLSFGLTRVLAFEFAEAMIVTLPNDDP